MGSEMCIRDSYPTDKNSGYTKQVAWIEKERYIALKVEYYDRKGALLKTLNASGFEQFLDKHWRPTQMDMVNHQSGKSTTLRFENYAFKTGLSDRDFAKNALKKLR